MKKYRFSKILLSLLMVLTIVCTNTNFTAPLDDTHNDCQLLDEDSPYLPLHKK